MKFFSQRGYSLVEALVYSFLFVLILITIVEALIIFTKSSTNIKAVKDVESSAYSSMDRMSREIRNGIDVKSTGSTFGTSTGSLSIDSLDSSGTAVVYKFYLSNGTVLMDKDGVLIGPLTQPGVQVTSLIFNYINASSSEAVKIEMTIQDTTSNFNIVKKFYSSAVLYGSYE